jgi:hypothetical protein
MPVTLLDPPPNEGIVVDVAERLEPLEHGRDDVVGCAR